MKYAIRFVHKVSSSPNDSASDPIELPEGATEDRRTLGAALRGSGASQKVYPGQTRVLMKGESVRDYRIDAHGRIIVFPTASVWHSIILTPLMPDGRPVVRTRAEVFASLWKDPRYQRLHATQDRANRRISFVKAYRCNDSAELGRAMRRFSRAARLVQAYEDRALAAPDVVQS